MLGDGLRLALAGIVLGAAAAFAAARLMSGLLFGIQPADPVTCRRADRDARHCGRRLRDPRTPRQPARPREYASMTAPLELLKGTLDVLILRTLEREAMHGYGVSRWIRERTGGQLAVEDAALYQALHRLERKGWIAAEWGASENKRRAKYYHLTARGRKQLQRALKDWQAYAAAVESVLT
ncbi:MAG: PadR family transcriptional regulator, partial [Longimicrobiales bacterium]